MVEKESSLDKIKRLVTGQKNIRNVATSAHIHHGKCIGGNSRVLLKDGKVRSAREIFEEISKVGKVHEENDDHVVYTPSNKIDIFSLNQETNKIEVKPIQYAWRLNGGNVIKIMLRNGFEISTTPEHKYLVSRTGLEYVEAKELKLGDRVVCSRKLNVEPERDENGMKEKILNKLSEKNFYVNLTKEFSETFNKKILDYGINNINTGLKKKSFYHGIWQNRYSLNDFVSMCEVFDIKLEDAYDKIDKIYFRTGKQRGQNSIAINLPSNFEEFFYLAGLFLGDGSHKKFITGKEQLALMVIEICKELGFDAKFVNRRDRTPEVHTNLTLVQIFNSLFDYPLKQILQEKMFLFLECQIFPLTHFQILRYGVLLRFLR